ncbi:maltase 2-like [Phlebotomus argentipes]|uniref:maltase 2-like n=1 Tax=Phlebotomus argentipes TaxID=94469 RepID=UPI0028935F90|nr:maltase 2-like [Phlebotomus argentipes]
MKLLGYLLATLAIALTAESHLLGDKRTVKADPRHDHPHLDWWQSTVLYQIYPRSFMDSDGDGIGDLNGISSRLAHLQEAGVFACWLSPIFSSPMKDFGYDISDFKSINPEYGTMEDFLQLLHEARRLNIRLILDFVPNHTSDLHEWFVKSEDNDPEYRDYYVWRDAKIVDGNREPPNNWLSVFHGPAWTWSEKRQQYYLHQFAKEQPDLNFENPRVVEEMTDVLKFWLDIGVDGFRVDAINHLFEDPSFADNPPNRDVYDPMDYNHFDTIYSKDLPKSYQQVYDWRRYMDEYAEEQGSDTKILLTEAYTDLTNTMKWYISEDGTQKGAHFSFNFQLIMGLKALPEQLTAADVKATIDEWFDHLPEGLTPNWVLGNHDRPRVASRFGVDLVDNMNILVQTLPGVAVTYYGEEIGMEDFRGISWEDTKDPQACGSNETVYQQYTRDPVRTPMQWDDSENAGFSTSANPWLPLHPNYPQNNLAQQKEQERSTFKLYQELVRLRVDHALEYGDFESVALGNVFAYRRHVEDHESLVIALNLGSTDATVDLSPILLESSYAEGTVDVSVTKSIYKRDDVVPLDSFPLPAYDGIILRVPSSATKIVISALSLLVSFLVLF